MSSKSKYGQQAMEKSVEVLCNLLGKKIIPNKCQNERYLHHYYSKQIQEHYEIDFKDLEKSELHPEWPTYKTGCDLRFSKYRKNDEKKYIVDLEDGSSAFIDFAIGYYKKPEFAIEFTSKYGFSSEDLIFDFMKLLDKNIPFEYVISFNLLYRENNLPKGGYKTDIIDALEETLTQISDAEKGRKLEIDERQFLFWIIEIDPNGNKRHWICKKIACGFEEVEDYQNYIDLLSHEMVYASNRNKP